MRIAFAVLVAICLTFSGWAVQFKGTGDDEAVSIANAKKMRDDSFVTLEGYIIKKLRDEHYAFRDDTGEIQVEIDDHVWGGRVIDSTTKVRISGELDADYASIEIEVYRIEIVN